MNKNFYKFLFQINRHDEVNKFHIKITLKVLIIIEKFIKQLWVAM